MSDVSANGFSAGDGQPARNTASQAGSFAGTVGSFAFAMIAFRLTYGAWPPNEGHLWSWLSSDSRAQLALLVGFIGAVIGGRVGRGLAGARSGTVGEGEDYVSETYRFGLRIPPGWVKRPLEGAFAEAGGQLVLWSPSRERQKANLNLSIGPPDSVRMVDKSIRATRLTSTVGPQATVDSTLSVGGNENAVRADWTESKRLLGQSITFKTGMLSVIHEGNEYVVQWSSDTARMTQIEEILASIRFA